jgi:hypothetical protein
MEISRERTQMDQHNRHHNQLLVTKILFQTLETAFKARKQMAMNEFFSYCKFDDKCHGALKRFIDIIDRLGKYKLKNAISQWHQKTFKPIEMIVQKEQLVEEFRRKHLLSRMFNDWRAKFHQRHNLFDQKNKAIKWMWNIKCKDASKELLRAFTIWKGALHFDNQKKLKIKRLMWKSFNNRLARAFETWVNFS